MTMASSTAALGPVVRPTPLRGCALYELGSEYFRADRRGRDLVAQVALDLRQRYGELFASEADCIAFRAGR